VLSVRVGCEFGWKAEIPTAAVVQVEPRPDVHPTIARASWSTLPDTGSRTYIDVFGNQCRRLVLPVGGLTVGYDAEIEVSAAPDEADFGAPELNPAELPDDCLMFTLASRLCQSDLLGDEAWSRFGQIPPGYSRVQAICDFVHGHLTWEAGASIPSTSAVDVFASGAGVCRDFAHLAITFCRALNIPARYAFGYLPDFSVPVSKEPMDFCAWMEVYLGDRWYTFDPRNNARRPGRVLIGRGRDALDVAMFTTFGGPELLELNVWANVIPTPAS
jgi:transglutaminase-like putative cysteine protease